MSFKVIHVDSINAAPLSGAFYTKLDVISSNLTYYGECLTQSAGDSDSAWRISKIYKQGTVLVTKYAGTGKFEHSWSARNTYFPVDSYFNNSSITLDGINDYINMGNTFNYDVANQFSASIWVNPDNTNALRCLIGKSETAGNVYGWALFHNADGTIRLYARAPSQLRFHDYVAVLPSQQWTHLTLTYAGNQNINGFNLYINGVLQAAPPTGVLTNSWLVGQSLVVGSRGTASFYYSGKVDEVSLWSTALNQAQVTEVYNLGAPTNLINHTASAGLVSWYRMGDGDTYPTVTDNKGTAHGTMTNMTAGSITSGTP